MNIKENFKLINKKESALIYILIIPLFFLLFIPAIATFIIRSFFSVFNLNKNKKIIDRKPASNI